MQLAHEHRAMARQSTWPELRPDGAGRMPNPAGGVWFRSWDTEADHDRVAAYHRTQAAELEAEYEEACGARSQEQVARSPLQPYLVGGWPTATGIIMYLSPDAGSADQLLADLKCHRAWMMLAPAPDMDACPLDLPGLALDARGDREGITVSIVVRDPKLVDELHRRAAHELEVSARQGGRSHP